MLFAIAPVRAEAQPPDRIRPKELASLLQEKKAVAVNVMSGIECRDHRIPGSLCLPAEETGGKMPQLVGDREKRIVFYGDGSSHEETAGAVKTAVSAGFGHAAVLEGGLEAWKAAGYAVESVHRIPRTPSLSVKPGRIRQWQEEGRAVFILDIRSAEAFGRDRVPGAVNIPFYLLDRRYDEVPLDRTVVVVDEEGQRSFLAASYLIRKGVSRVVRLTGGMQGWKAHPAMKGR